MVTSTSLLSMRNTAHVPLECTASVAVQVHEFYIYVVYIYIFHGFCFPYTASQKLVACSTEEYKAPGQPEQDVFQDGSGRTWDRCTVTGLFSSEVNDQSCDCSLALCHTAACAEAALYTWCQLHVAPTAKPIIPM